MAKLRSEEIKVKCPNCGEVHTIKEWNEATLKVWDDPVLLSEVYPKQLDEWLYICPSCEKEAAGDVEFVDYDIMAEVLSDEVYCPECGKMQTREEWENATKLIGDFDHIIKIGDKSYGGCFFFCPNCRGMIDEYDLKFEAPAK
jgi:ssDNA-binding Zn-finger/Zn-ribbon topoisomerase 1